MKIKENIITTMDQPEAMQEDGDNWNQEEMLQAAVGLIELDSDLQSSGIVPRPLPLKVTVTVIMLGDWYQDVLHKKSTDSDLLPRGLMHLI